MRTTSGATERKTACGNQSCRRGRRTCCLCFRARVGVMRKRRAIRSGRRRSIRTRDRLGDRMGMDVQLMWMTDRIRRSLRTVLLISCRRRDRCLAMISEFRHIRPWKDRYRACNLNLSRGSPIPRSTVTIMDHRRIDDRDTLEIILIARRRVLRGRRDLHVARFRMGDRVILQ